MNIFEFGLLRGLHEALGCPFMDFLMPLVTKLGDHGIFCIAVAVALLCFKKTRRAGVMMGIALLCGFICGNLLRARARMICRGCRSIFWLRGCMIILFPPGTRLPALKWQAC